MYRQNLSSFFIQYSSKKSHQHLKSCNDTLNIVNEDERVVIGNDVPESEILAIVALLIRVNWTPTLRHGSGLKEWHPIKVTDWVQIIFNWKQGLLICLVMFRLSNCVPLKSVQTAAFSPTASRIRIPALVRAAMVNKLLVLRTIIDD